MALYVLRICGDYKLTANRAVKVHTLTHFPDRGPVHSHVRRSKTVFMKLDLLHAYLQLLLEEESKEYLTINTHKGLFEYDRLPFGVSSAPSIFQCSMGNILQGIDNIAVYINDKEEHLRTLEEVLQCLDKAGMCLKKDKCVFMVDSVEYLGYRISKTGLHPTDEKVRAITRAPKPTNVSELKGISRPGKFSHSTRPIVQASPKEDPLAMVSRTASSLRCS